LSAAAKMVANFDVSQQTIVFPPQADSSGIKEYPAPPFIKKG